ncbi:MAG: thioesterase family protein [Bacteroidota bacterium]
MDRTTFKFASSLRVRNYEIDWQGIVHNANYLMYFEVGRLEYLQHLGVTVNMHTIQNDAKVVLVRNEINYKSPAVFNQLLTIRTRISRIGNTSFTFEGIIEEAETGKIIADGIAYHVWLDPQTDTATSVPEHFREIVRKFEGTNVEIL